MNSKQLTAKLTELGEEIGNLKTKTTELTTAVSIVNKELNETGIKDPEKAHVEIKKIMKEINEFDAEIHSLVDEIEELLEMGE